MDVKKIFRNYAEFLDKSTRTLFIMFFVFPFVILFLSMDFTKNLFIKLGNFFEYLFENSKVFRYFCLVLASPLMLTGFIIFSLFYGIYLLYDYLKEEEGDN